MQRAHSAEVYARMSLAGVRGRAVWVERMRLAKALGLIDRFPCGAKKGLRGMIEEARAVVAAAKAAPAGSELSEHGKRLQTLTGKSLDVLESILDRKRAWKGDMAKHKALQKETAVSVLNAQMRVDENVLRVRQAEALGPVLAALLTAAGEPVVLTPLPGKAEEETS